MQRGKLAYQENCLKLIRSKISETEKQREERNWSFCFDKGLGKREKEGESPLRNQRPKFSQIKEFVNEKDVRLIGVEAAGFGLDSGKHAATLTKGEVGVLHGAMSYLLQDEDGQIVEPHSISAG